MKKPKSFKQIKHEKVQSGEGWYVPKDYREKKGKEWAYVTSNIGTYGRILQRKSYAFLHMLTPHIRFFRQRDQQWRDHKNVITRKNTDKTDHTHTNIHVKPEVLLYFNLYHHHIHAPEFRGESRALWKPSGEMIMRCCRNPRKHQITSKNCGTQLILCTKHQFSFRVVFVCKSHHAHIKQQTHCAPRRRHALISPITIIVFTSCVP